ncbi:MAG: hypothetical protein R3B99_08570 [Polyangiales bacterium]
MALFDEARLEVDPQGRVLSASEPGERHWFAAAAFGEAWAFVDEDHRVHVARSPLGSTTATEKSRLWNLASVQRTALVGMVDHERAFERTRSGAREVTLPWTPTLVGAFDAGRFAVLPGGALALGASLETLQVRAEPDAVVDAWAWDEGLVVITPTETWWVDAELHATRLSPSNCRPLVGVTEARLGRVPWVEGVVRSEGRRAWVEGERLEVLGARGERSSWPWPPGCALHGGTSFFALCRDADFVERSLRLTEEGWVEVARGSLLGPDGWVGTCEAPDPASSRFCVLTRDGAIERERPRFVPPEPAEVSGATVCGPSSSTPPTGHDGVWRDRTFRGRHEPLGCVQDALWGLRDERLYVWTEDDVEPRGWMGSDVREPLVSNGRHALVQRIRGVLRSTSTAVEPAGRKGVSAADVVCAPEGCVARSGAGRVVATTVEDDGWAPQVDERGRPVRTIMLSRRSTRWMR